MRTRRHFAAVAVGLAITIFGTNVVYADGLVPDAGTEVESYTEDQSDEASFVLGSEPQDNSEGEMEDNRDRDSSDQREGMGNDYVANETSGNDDTESIEDKADRNRDFIIEEGNSSSDFDDIQESKAVSSGAEFAGSDDRHSLPSLKFRTHVQTYGWLNWCGDGETSGTLGEAKRMEAIQLQLEGDLDLSGGIAYRTHVQTYGWQGWKTDGQTSGTSGEGKRLEAIQIRLIGEVANRYDIYYRTHVQHFGWLDWAKNGQSSGSEGFSYRLEAIEVLLVEKDSAAPGNTQNRFYTNTAKVVYQTHVQTIGWQNWKTNGETAGTSGQYKRLEGIRIKAGSGFDGGITYRTHVQTYGWQGWKSGGDMSGTSGQSKRLEAIQVKLTGTMAKHYNIFYRVHAQHFGWMGWTKNGESAGTAGYAYRLEAIQIKIIPVGLPSPGSSGNAYKQYTPPPAPLGPDGSRQPILVEKGYTVSRDDDYTRVSYVVKLKNPNTRVAIECPRIKIVCRDASGKILAVHEDVDSYIVANDELCCGGDVFYQGEKPSSVSFSVSVDSVYDFAQQDNTRHVKQSAFTFRNISEQYYEYSGSITGEVQNTSRIKQSSLEIDVLYKKNGKYVGSDLTYVYNLEAGASTEFEIQPYRHIDHDSIELVAIPQNQ